MFIILIKIMSISIHIPFYNPNPEKKEGFRNLRRFDYLKENILNLKSLSIKNDIFIHTHNDFLDDKNLEGKIIKHKIDENNLNKGYLTWLCRSLMEKQEHEKSMKIINEIFSNGTQTNEVIEIFIRNKNAKIYTE